MKHISFCSLSFAPLGQPFKVTWEKSRGHLKFLWLFQGQEYHRRDLITQTTTGLMEHKEWSNPLMVRKKIIIKKIQIKPKNINKPFAFNKQVVYPMMTLNSQTTDVRWTIMHEDSHYIENLPPCEVSSIALLFWKEC